MTRSLCSALAERRASASPPTSGSRFEVDHVEISAEGRQRLNLLSVSTVSTAA